MDNLEIFYEMFPNIETVGVDLHTGRVDFGNELIKEHGLSNIKLVTDNVFNFKLEDTDLLWQSNLCFENKVAEKLTKIKKKTLSNIVNDNVSARGIEAKNIAVAGVGRPINSLICFLSRLKLANL